MFETTTISGRIARHDEPVFWGRITINKRTGHIIEVARGTYVPVDHAFGPDCLIFAGFGDIHIHAREDETGKQNYKEDYQTAGDAALNGGVVHACAMPNTPNPVTTAERLAWHRCRLQEINHPVVMLNYVGIDATTNPVGRKNQNPYKLYFGKSVGTLSVTFASELDEILPAYAGEYVSFHVEYEPIVLMSAAGKTHSDRRPVECVNEGLRLLLPLIEKYKIKAKLCHWSTGGESFSLIAEYRERGCHIELEVSPLHLFFDTSMTDEDPSLWTKVQMNPAIQVSSDREALIHALRVGFIDHLATDHAPHTEEEKYSAFERFKDQAHFHGMTNKQIAERIQKNSPSLFDECCVKNNHSGAPWLDTYAIACIRLMNEHKFTPQDIARVASYNPGHFTNKFLKSQYPNRDFGMGFGDIKVGYMGSITVLNIARVTTIIRKNLKTKVGWSAFEGQIFHGALQAVFVAGVQQ